MLEHSTGSVSVHAKCVSHTGVDSKLMIVGLCGFHHWVAQRLFETNFCALGTRGTILQELQTRLGWVKTVKKINDKCVRNDRR